MTYAIVGAIIGMYGGRAAAVLMCDDQLTRAERDYCWAVVGVFVFWLAAMVVRLINTIN